jgi:hypothetical protein
LSHLRRCGQWLQVFHSGVHRVHQHAWEMTDFEADLLERRGHLLVLGVPRHRLDPLCHSILTKARSVSSAAVPSQCFMVTISCDTSGLRLTPFRFLTSVISI